MDRENSAMLMLPIINMAKSVSGTTACWDWAPVRDESAKSMGMGGKER